MNGHWVEFANRKSAVLQFAFLFALAQTSINFQT